jgi:TRAP-type C4-dicarboxylate transport system permease large subunit
VPLSRIFKGVLPFLMADLVHVLMIILFPALVLALPHWMGQ